MWAENKLEEACLIPSKGLFEHSLLVWAALRDNTNLSHKWWATLQNTNYKTQTAKHKHSHKTQTTKHKHKHYKTQTTVQNETKMLSIGQERQNIYAINVKLTITQLQNKATYCAWEVPWTSWKRIKDIDGGLYIKRFLQNAHPGAGVGINWLSMAMVNWQADHTVWLLIVLG